MIEKDRTKEVRGAVKRVTPEALTASAMVVQGQTILLAPVDTGNLRSSITFVVEGLVALIGTNVEYAPYPEFGTVNMKPQPYLRSGLLRSKANVRQIFKSDLGRAIKGAI